MSNDSVFEVQSLHDFLETLVILGFSRSVSPEKDQTQLCYRFVHPHFNQSNPIPEDLYKHKMTQSIGVFKNTKRMIESSGSHVLQRILYNRSWKEVQQISKLDLAQKKLSFALQKQLDALRGEPADVECHFEVPDYMKENQIAGYYGNVSLEQLTIGFQNYLPVYHEVPPPTEFVKCEETQAVEDPMLVDLKEEEIPIVDFVEIKPEVTPKKRFDRKRKYTKEHRQAYEENEKAWLHLYKEECMMGDNEEWSFFGPKVYQAIFAFDFLWYFLINLIQFLAAVSAVFLLMLLSRYTINTKVLLMCQSPWNFQPFESPPHPLPTPFDQTKFYL